MSRKRTEPIKILKPYKFARQKNESHVDATEAVGLISKIVKSIGTHNVEIISNRIENDADIISNPERVVNQMLDIQDSTMANPDGTGKRVYSMIYKFPKDYDVTTDEVVEMTESLLEKYPEFQSVAIINQDENKDIYCGIAFNNYSIDGESKMSKRFRPYNMSNIYNRYIEVRARE